MMRADIELAEEMRTSSLKCRKWLETFADLPDAAARLADLLDAVVVNTIEDCVLACKRVQDQERVKIGESRTRTWRDGTVDGARMCVDRLEEMLRPTHPTDVKGKL